MLQCRHLKFSTSATLCYHALIRRRCFRKLKSCVRFKGGEYDGAPNEHHSICWRQKREDPGEPGVIRPQYGGHVCEQPLSGSRDRKSMQIQISQEGRLNPLLRCIHMRRSPMDKWKSVPPTASDKRREVLCRILEIWSSDWGFVAVHIYLFFFLFLNCLAGLISASPPIDLTAFFMFCKLQIWGISSPDSSTLGDTEI